MNINSNSRLIWWAFAKPDYYVEWFVNGKRPYIFTPGSTSLCALFWRTVLLAPLYHAIGGAIGLIMIGAYYLLWLPLLAVSSATFALIARRLPPNLSDRIVSAMEARVENSVERGLLHMAFETKKRMCPIITIYPPRPSPWDLFCEREEARAARRDARRNSCDC